MAHATAGAGVHHGPAPSAQLAPDHLAQRVARQRVDQADLAGHLNGASSAAASSWSEAGPGSPTTKATTVSPHSAEGTPDDGHLDHTGVAGQDRLDLGRVDVVPAGDDQLGAPPADGHVAVVGHRDQVAGGEPVTLAKAARPQ